MKATATKATKFLILLSTLGVLGLVDAAPVSAQWVYDNRASTAEEGIARGISDITRARGERNVMDAEASIRQEEARSMEMDNRIQATQTYWERRRINAENRYYSKEEKAAIRERNLEKRMFNNAKRAQGTRPGAGKLDPVTGAIRWPIALMSPRYASYREPLEQLFAERADKQGAIGYETYRKITRLTKEFLEEVRKVLRTEGMGQRDFLQAKRFLQSLEVEARHAVV
ncbi:MAG: hypothetical protein DWQ31_21085 [Planctomycetota bacterium]|nr:MAG: hypothetical protein DWQ31_21085 [Planctomycetota bacterium]REJ91069.1 MAG: hypothetical protein DWQ35_15240 [Planctomycetota bacterium]REK22196.1 MAG: hypothetical protein DWQ42_17725 [Planctomycetota bacterium]REK44282.1 MAG: hypothetical protein DWQ46_10330 [Planctomycetota bacterium]